MSEQEKAQMAVDSARNAAPSEEEKLSPPSASKSLRVTKEEIRAVAQKFADEQLECPDPGVWGVLSAISHNARQRRQGMNIQLSLDEHRIGRCVEDSRFQINSLAISASHCRIYKDNASEDPVSNSRKVFVKDTSTNGTYLNWNRLRKDMPASWLRHGDILAFAAQPHEDKSYAYVYREVCGARLLENGTATLKRQREEVSFECKRQKGIGIGCADGPVSLDDVRSLQRSNSDLRQQLELHVATIETLKSESRESISRHENEIKELRESISSSFDKQIKELKHALDEKQKELDLLNTVKVEIESSIKDLNERLTASKESRADADEIILCQKATISELETQLEEERKMRTEEREKAAEDLKSAVEKAQAEAKEESKRQANIYQRQHKEQQEVITKLQEAEKESRLVVEALRSKLEDNRENLIISEQKVRQLESQVQDEQLVSSNRKKKSETLESELRSLKAEIENEKVAREEAWAKVSALELDMAAAIRDLSTEKQRLQGARERVILRETQLRAFYSMTEEISALFAKQQEQLKAMQRTLEDEEHYDNTLTGINLEKTPPGNLKLRNEDMQPNTNNGEAPQKCVAKSTNSGSADEDASTTEENSDGGDTQNLECTSADRSVQLLTSSVNGGVSASTAVANKKDQTDTERVLETESQIGDGTFQKCCNMEGETMQLDEETHPVENFTEPVTRPEVQAALEDTEPGQLRTADLLTSEGVGSWAVSTAPSIIGENDSVKEANNAEAVVADALICLGSEASGSQSNKGDESRKLTREHQRLSAMIEIVDPEFAQKFSAGGGGVGKGCDISDADSEEDEDNKDNKDGGDDGSDETDPMIEDSIG